ALVGLWLFRLSDRRALTGGSKGAPPAPRLVRRAWLRRGIAAGAWILALVLLLPHATLLLVSFVPIGTWTTEALPPVYTIDNYITLVRDPVRFRPLVNSLWMATVATVAAVSFAVAVGLLVVRRRVRMGGALEGLLTLPWAVPGTVFAIAIATAFSVDAPRALRFVLVGTLWILPLAY